ncbi:uncharacterized protein LOC124816294 [Hydra vulgaris]|uniref:uncharacterized protein LOC124816294 n=1 Tax=Hydra vulgaris TaxID=6087 RepID=UPI001F5ED3F3|nr:uncharacterized protein LOC124816294 [Hydra vulgaris]
MHSPLNVLLAITSFWDLLVGMFANVPMAVVLIMSVSMSHNCVLFLFTIFTSYAFGFLSFLTVCMTSFDRYLAVFQPFFYQKYVDGNPRFYIKWNIIIATIVMLVIGFSFLTQNKVLCELFILSISPILIPVVLYIHTRLHMRVKLVRRQISVNNPNVYASNERKNEHIADKKIKSDAKINRILPSGFITFLSDCYGGRCSDNFITKDSGFYDLLERDDKVMADHGFQIQEELLLRFCTLIISPGARLKSQMIASECKKTKK